MKKSFILVLALSLVLFSTACTTGWVSTLDSILAAAAPALSDILQIVAVANGQPVNSRLAAKINADALAIKTLAGDFAQASSGSGPGVCEGLQAAVSSYQADEQLVLQVAQVTDANTQTKIRLLSDLVAGTVGAITAAIPSCQNAADFHHQGVEAAPAYSASTFAERYNRILIAPTGNPAVDAMTATLKLHRHSKFVRVVTFGTIR